MMSCPLLPVSFILTCLPNSCATDTSFSPQTSKHVNAFRYLLCSTNVLGSMTCCLHPIFGFSHSDSLSFHMGSLLGKVLSRGERWDVFTLTHEAVTVSSLKIRRKVGPISGGITHQQFSRSRGSIPEGLRHTKLCRLRRVVCVPTCCQIPLYIIREIVQANGDPTTH
jgi:hypothetical protein